jgi:hypothetical protein
MFLSRNAADQKNHNGLAEPRRGLQEFIELCNPTVEPLAFFCHASFFFPVLFLPPEFSLRYQQ